MILLSTIGTSSIGDLNTHIATGYHDTIGNLEDLVQILDTLQARSEMI